MTDFQKGDPHISQRMSKHAFQEDCGGSVRSIAVAKRLDVIAQFNDAASLVIALRAAKHRRNISFATLDHLADLADHASSKLLGPNPARVIGELSFAKLLFGLGLKCVLVDDPDVL